MTQTLNPSPTTRIATPFGCSATQLLQTCCHPKTTSDSVFPTFLCMPQITQPDRRTEALSGVRLGRVSDCRTVRRGQTMSALSVVIFTSGRPPGLRPASAALREKLARRPKRGAAHASRPSSCASRWLPMTTQSSSSRNGAGAAAADAGHDLVARAMCTFENMWPAGPAMPRYTRIQEHQPERLPGYPASRSVRCSWQSDARLARATTPPLSLPAVCLFSAFRSYYSFKHIRSHIQGPRSARAVRIRVHH